MNLTTLSPFSLIGTDNKVHSTDDYSSKDAIVIIFTCNHCPVAQAYVQRINKLVADYEKRNIGFYAVSANDAVKYPQDSFENMIAMGKELNLDGKYLYDETQQVAKAYGAQRTPEVYIFNKHKQLAYHGAIDDNHATPSAVKQHFVRDALDAILAGKDAPVKETKAMGCTIKWK